MSCWRRIHCRMQALLPLPVPVPVLVLAPVLVPPCMQAALPGDRRMCSSSGNCAIGGLPTCCMRSWSAIWLPENGPAAARRSIDAASLAAWLQGAGGEDCSPLKCTTICLFACCSGRGGEGFGGAGSGGRGGWGVGGAHRWQNPRMSLDLYSMSAPARPETQPIRCHSPRTGRLLHCGAQNSTRSYTSCPNAQACKGEMQQIPRAGLYVCQSMAPGGA